MEGGKPLDDCKVIAITNQKDGVGKTTTTVNLGVGLSNAGKRVLLIDADPQASLSICLGHKNPDDLDVTLAIINSVIVCPGSISLFSPTYRRCRAAR